MESKPYTQKFGERMSLNREEKIAAGIERINIRLVLYQMRYGAERRALILKWLEDNDMFRINDNHNVQMHQDIDLQKLLKQGKIKTIRTYVYLSGRHKKIWKTRGKCETYVVGAKHRLTHN